MDLENGAEAQQTLCIEGQRPGDMPAQGKRVRRVRALRPFYASAPREGCKALLRGNERSPGSAVQKGTKLKGLDSGEPWRRPFSENTGAPGSVRE